MVAIDTELSIHESDFTASVIDIVTIKNGEEAPGIKDVLDICIEEGIVNITEAPTIAIKKI